MNKYLCPHSQCKNLQRVVVLEVKSCLILAKANLRPESLTMLETDFPEFVRNLIILLNAQRSVVVLV